MSLGNKARSANAVVSGDIGMTDAMRTIMWITGVAFGVVPPGAFSQPAAVAGATQKNSPIQKLDANPDGFISPIELHSTKGDAT